MFLALPTEVFLVIRECLIEFNVDDAIVGIREFVRREAERSWRSFLVVSKTFALLRKETMVWSLNKMTFRKYLVDAQFRQDINDRMVNPANQLQSIYSPESECTIENVFVLEIISTSRIACISISSSSHLMELPSSSGLQVLKLNDCPSVNRIGDYPHLMTLEVNECPCLESIGRLENLQNLLFVFLASKTALPLEELLSQFPLEQIQQLSLGYITDAFFTLSTRLQGLQYLRLFQIFESSMIFTGGLFPCLIELHTIDFTSVKLAGMAHLRHLEIRNTPNNQIFGKDAVYPQLKSFSHSYFSSDIEDSSSPGLLKNVTRLSIEESQPSLPPDFLLSMNKKVTSLDLYIQSQKVTIPDRFFEMVKLDCCYFNQASDFSKVQMLLLNHCPSVTDISPIKDIRFLQLMNLPEVQNFSCLGTQRYLMIHMCPSLSNEDVRGFGNVFHLCISYCRTISEVTTHLKGNNKFLTLTFCLGLKSVELSGDDYIQVRIIKCGNLDNFKIQGSIYSLDFTLSERWTKETIPRKYQYLNGEEKSEEVIPVK
jgi:hypothetical protein